MELLFGFVTIGMIGLLGAMSPGPDFAVVTKNSLLHSRKIGVYTALGVGVGILVHVAYSLVGIGFIISRSVLLFSVIKFVGAGYLVYLGYQLLRSKREDLNMGETKRAVDNTLISPSTAFKNGFFTNALNPKATIFFLSVFTQVIDPHTALFIQFAYGLEIAVIVGAWFSVLAYFLSTTVVQKRFIRIKHYFERATGAILILLGIKVALSSQK